MFFFGLILIILLPFFLWFGGLWTALLERIFSSFDDERSHGRSTRSSSDREQEEIRLHAFGVDRAGIVAANFTFAPKSRWTKFRVSYRADHLMSVEGVPSSGLFRDAAHVTFGDCQLHEVECFFVELWDRDGKIASTELPLYMARPSIFQVEYLEGLFAVHPWSGRAIGHSESHCLHVSECSIAALILAQNRREFGSVQEGLKAGFRPGTCCLARKFSW